MDITLLHKLLSQTTLTIQLDSQPLTSTIPSPTFLSPRLRLAPRTAAAVLRGALLLALAASGNRERPAPIAR